MLDQIEQKNTFLQELKCKSVLLTLDPSNLTVHVAFPFLAWLVHDGWVWILDANCNVCVYLDESMPLRGTGGLCKENQMQCFMKPKPTTHHTTTSKSKQLPG